MIKELLQCLVTQADDLSVASWYCCESIARTIGNLADRFKPISAGAKDVIFQGIPLSGPPDPFQAISWLLELDTLWSLFLFLSHNQQSVRKAACRAITAVLAVQNGTNRDAVVSLVISRLDESEASREDTDACATDGLMELLSCTLKRLPLDQRLALWSEPGPCGVSICDVILSS